ncbi:EndoU domain-containing protein [Aerococcaceae bacterium zg-BR22]|uniref:EndoU domain-containing protein n=1 Tax=Aerococcaceae bacterium zg-1292 TaxID=2774330 RepID=UPI004064B27D|nr:EndoU domain-containing protein [Aerococcaceae bacterium zg-BR22]
MKRLLKVIALVFATLLFVGCQPQIPSPPQTTSQTNQTSQTSQTASNSKISDINDLVNTDYFNRHALEHIFYGTINRKGQATGYHHEGIAPDAEIIQSTRSKNDRHGVYRAKVRVEGINKKAMSSFFPEQWTAQQVVDAINEAYESREHVSGNIYEGTFDGITIQMYLTDNDKIISAFPIYER